MPKSASQIVPLKTQLAQTLAIFRWADTSDFLQSGFNGGNYVPLPTATVSDVTLDNSGAATYPGFVTQAGVNAGGTTVGSLNVATGSALPVNLTTPSGFGISTSTTGGSLRPTSWLYGIAARNATTGQYGNPVWVVATYPTNGSVSGSITLNWTAPAGNTVNGYRILKQDPAGTWSYTDNGTPVTWTDTGNPYTNIGNGFYPGLDPATNSDPVTNLTIAYNAAGGAMYAPTYAFRVGAWNGIGDTLAAAAVEASIAPVNAFTMGVVTPTTSTSSGALAANTYYYQVTAFGSNGLNLGLETLPSAEVSATLGATGNITLSWAAVAGATGYAVYRSTATGTERYLASVSGGAVTSYVDTGAATPVAKWTVPASNTAGWVLTASVTVSWSAVASTGGYYVFYGRGAPNLGNNINVNYLAVAAGTTTLVYTGQAATGTRYVPAYNYAAVGATGNITTVGRYIQFPGQGGSSNANMLKIGMVASLVPGKQYHWVMFNVNATPLDGGTFTASSSAFQYYETTVNGVFGNYQYMVCLMGNDSGSYITWQNSPRPVTDNYVASLVTDGGTFVSSANGNLVTFPQMLQPYGGAQPDGRGVLVKDDTLASVPMRFTWRQSLTSASQISTRGTLLNNPANSVATPMTAYTYNQAYSTPVKSIVPTWNCTVPSNSYQSAQQFIASRYVVEVSTDAGATWTTVYLNQRYQFATPATQLQWRITAPPRVAQINWVKGVTSPFTSSTPNGSYGPTNNQPYGTYGIIADTGQVGYDYSAYGTSSTNGYFPGDGFYWPGYSPQVDGYEMFGIQQFGHDVDVQCWVNPQGRQAGPAACHLYGNSGSDTSTGYSLQLNSSGQAILLKHVGGASGTALATVSNVGFNNQYNLVRLVVVGAHILGWVNNRLVIDLQDSTYSTASHSNVGVRGTGGSCTLWSAANLTAGQTNVPQWELEFLGAYLET